MRPPVVVLLKLRDSADNGRMPLMPRRDETKAAPVR
jgi:hypothetical protein